MDIHLLKFYMEHTLLFMDMIFYIVKLIASHHW